MRHNFLETITGAVVLLVAGIFFAFSYQFSTSSRAETIKVFATFDRADGISVGNDVRMGGVNIGHVTHMGIDKKTFKAILRLDIDASLKVPADSSAEISSESLMGGKYVNISPGGDDTFLKAGDSITLTQSAISFEGLLSKYIFTQGDDKKDKK
jgi:phospholipid/cholesterol/gamma-HCH transport system substrate-binding protein